MNNIIHHPYVCFFPTRTVFIDDKEEFLDSIALQLNYRLQSYRFFSNVNTAIDFIFSNYPKSEWFSQYIKPIEEEEAEHKIIELDIHALHHQIYDANRFDIITSVIVDYDMPEKNGLALAQEICELKLYKILFTGAADERLAVDAFNEHLIDAFILKHHRTVHSSLKQLIEKSAHTYFKNLSEIFLNSANKNYYPRFFKEQAFIDLFNSVLHKNEIIEYYMIEMSGSFLMLNIEGRIDLFFLSSEKSINAMCQLAVDEGLPEKILNALYNRQKMLCFYDLDNKTFSIQKDWQDYIEDTTPIILGTETYYFAYKKNVTSNINLKPFKEYMLTASC